jgi:hypothetical protein
MEKEFIPYEQALELKELGFNEPCLKYWNGIGKYFDQKDWFDWNQSEYFVSVPLYQQAFRWFREKCGISFHISDYYGEESRKLYGRAFQIFINGRQQSFDYSSSSTTELYFTYPEAELACLIKLIEIVKNSK